MQVAKIGHHFSERLSDINDLRRVVDAIAEEQLGRLRQLAAGILNKVPHRLAMRVTDFANLGKFSLDLADLGAGLLRRLHRDFVLDLFQNPPVFFEQGKKGVDGSVDQRVHQVIGALAANLTQRLANATAHRIERVPFTFLEGDQGLTAKDKRDLLEGGRGVLLADAEHDHQPAADHVGFGALVGVHNILERQCVDAEDLADAAKDLRVAQADDIEPLHRPVDVVKLVEIDRIVFPECFPVIHHAVNTRRGRRAVVMERTGAGADAATAAEGPIESLSELGAMALGVASIAQFGSRVAFGVAPEPKRYNLLERFNMSDQTERATSTPTEAGSAEADSGLGRLRYGAHRRQDAAKELPRVVVVGGGFAGLQAVRSLARTDVQITLVDRRNFHLFQPLLYQVATGELSPANIATPLRWILRRQRNVSVVLGEVTGFAMERSVVQLSDGEVPFDYLILAAGTMHHYFGNHHWAQFAPGLKTIENATEIRRQILGAFEAAERCDDPHAVASLLTFVIVGAGPTGCELAGALAEIAHDTLEHDFRHIDPRQARIILVEAAKAALEVYPPELSQRAAEDLRGLGVEVRVQTRVVDVTATSVTVSDQTTGETESIETRTVIWAAGVQGNPLGEILGVASGLPTARGGRLAVEEDLSLPGHRNVFVVGDLAYFDHGGRGPVPGLAPAAIQMGRSAGESIRADLVGKPRRVFRYHDRGSMAVIGRYSAVGMIGDRKIKGIIAWALWLGVHLMYITMFRNRLLVLMQWGWTFLTHDRSARLIADGPAVDIPTMERATGWDDDPLVSRKRSRPQEIGADSGVAGR